MKNLFFVSVALGIFSGTSLSVNAQTSVNLVRLNAAAETTNTPAPKFIEGIEIKRDAKTVTQPVANAPEVKPVQPAEGIVLPKKITNFKHTGITAVASIESCSSLQFKYAQMLDVAVEEISDLPLYNFIEDWWATRYRYGGTGRTGIDCSAYAAALNKEVFGISLPRTARAQYAACDKIAKDDLKEGDLVFFNTRGGVSHVGVYLGNHYFTHSSVHGGVTISSLDDDYYSRKFIIGGRIAPTTEITDTVANP